MSETPDDPTPELRALHVSLGGRKIVKVKPNSGKVSIAGKTWTLDASCLAPGDGKFDVILIEGRGRAVSFQSDLENPSPEEWDQATHNNLLKQIHDLSQPVKTPALSWVNIIVLGLVVLAVIGGSIKNANDAKAIRGDILHLETVLATQGYTNLNGGDTTQVNTNPHPSNGSG